MFRNIFNTFANCFKIPELKSRILFTLALLGICRLMAYIVIPGVNGTALATYFKENEQSNGGLLGMYNMFAGGAFGNCAIGALGIMPYISATIIIQLLTAVWPKLSKLAREEGGRTQIVKYGRYLTVLICLGQGVYFANSWEHPQTLYRGFQGSLVLISNPIWFLTQTTLIMTTGTLLLMWLGEQITDRGVGNGVSLVITIGIVARLPNACLSLYQMFFPTGGMESDYHFMGTGVVLVLLMILVIGGVIAITQAQRKVPVQYAQRAVGRKLYSGGTSFLPIRVNNANVMPIIFAQSILMFPAPVCGWLADVAFRNVSFLQEFFREIALRLGYGSVVYLSIYGLMILFFSYFWNATTFNEIQIADDMKKNGGYVPGVRPGQATAEYLHNALSRLTLAGAIFLTIIAVIPIIMRNAMDIPSDVSNFFGGTSILITVGVLLDTMRQVESHLMMRHYDGFLKKGRLRGRF